MSFLRVVGGWGGGGKIKFVGASQLFIGQAPKQESVSSCSCHYMSFNLTNSPSQVLALIITYISTRTDARPNELTHIKTYTRTSPWVLLLRVISCAMRLL